MTGRSGYTEVMRQGRIIFFTAMMTSALGALSVLGGCVQRTVTIESSPPEALVWLNDREVGRTPLEVDFLFYGDYDVRLVRTGYESKMTSGKVSPPLWDMVPLDFFAELLPVDLHSRRTLSYTLEPVDPDRDRLLERANTLREQISTQP